MKRLRGGAATALRTDSKRFAISVVLVFVIGVMCHPPSFAQRSGLASAPVDLPNGPAKPGFEITRFSPAGNGWFKTFYVRETHPLQKVLEEGRVAADTGVLVTHTAGGDLALLMDQMAYHHIAQGRAGNKDWMVSF